MMEGQFTRLTVKRRAGLQRKERSRVLNGEHYLTLSVKDGFKNPFLSYGSPSFLNHWCKEESILSVTRRCLFCLLCYKRP